MFENVEACVLLNKMIIELNKTAEIVLHRPSPHQDLHPSVIDFI